MSVKDLVLPWVQVLSPACTVVLSGLLAWLTYRNSKRDFQIRDEKRDAEREAQASKVSAWWGESNAAFGVFVKNASDTPIYQTFATAADLHSESAGVRIACGTVPPANEAKFYAVAGAEAKDIRTGIRRVGLSFTDAAGHRWHRNRYGKLTDLPKELHIKTDPFRTDVLVGLTQEFRNAYGVEMKFEAPDRGGSGAQTRYLRHMERNNQAEQKQIGKLDAVICPHDWIGSMAAAGLIDVLADSDTLRSFFTAWAIQPLTVNGRLYGLPTTADTVALITNTSLANPPESLDDLVEVGQELRLAGSVSHIAAVRTGPNGNPFQIWPVFTSAGGWLFKQASVGTWDYSQVGIDSAESVAALSKLREWGTSGLGILDPTTTADVALGMYAEERTPFLITSSDLLVELRSSPVWAHSKVTAVPPFVNGKPATPMTVIHGLVVCSAGQNSITAQDLFADYLTQEHVLGALSDGTLAPTATKQDTGSIAPVFHELCATGVAVPTHPRMNEIWRVLEKCELDTVSGSASIDEIASRAANHIRELLA